MPETPIRVVVCRMGQDPVIEMVDNTLEAKQELVGGYIEVVSLSFDPPIDLICDEEFLLKDKPLNRVLRLPEFSGPLAIGGDFLICGVDLDDGEFVSLTEEQAEHWRSLVATSLTYEQALAKGIVRHADRAAGRELLHCHLCGSPAVIPTDFRDDLSRKEATISGTCQRCQDQLFKKEVDDG